MVKARRRVIITERGSPVAEIVPYRQKRAERLRDRIAGMILGRTIVQSRERFDAGPLIARPGAVGRFLKRDRE